MRGALMSPTTVQSDLISTLSLAVMFPVTCPSPALTFVLVLINPLLGGGLGSAARVPPGT
jgi:hypothetical protein